ncbi:MAG: DUF6049 family protein [Actinomycetota bacterium]|nr:DUF6049 family protein [Actinomycetota bacterium]
MHASTARRRAIVPAFALMLLASLTLATIAGSAPATPPSGREDSGVLPVTLDTGELAVPADGEFSFRVGVEVDRPTSYLEVRLQIRRSTGRLLYQKTEIRHEVATGTVDITFSRGLADLDLEADAYPIEVRVRSDSGEVREWTIEDRLLVFDRNRTATPVVLVAALDSPPIFDPQGRAATDPSTSDAARRQTDELCRLILGKPEIRVTLAAPPLVFEEWARISLGYDLAAPEGVVTVPAEDPTPKRYSATLDVLRTAIGTGRLELLSVPYAQPDTEGLQAIDRMLDLTQHYERGLSSSLAALETTPSPGTMLAAGALPSEALAAIGGRGLTYAVTTTASVEPQGELVPGLHVIERSNLRVLLVDRRASAGLASGDPRGLADSVFDRYRSETPGQPVVALVQLGRRGGSASGDLARCATSLSSASWVRLVSGTQAAAGDAGADIRVTAAPDTGTDAPGGYWSEVSTARAYAQALVAAVGEQDSGANSTVAASLIAESRSWAGSDGSWSLADRGRAYAAAARRASEAILDGVSIIAKDVTLSSARGDIPVVIANGTERELAVTLRAEPSGLGLIGESSKSLVLRPSDNFITVPVDLKSALSGRLKLGVWAGDVRLDETTVTVRASYLDRLVTVSGLAVILIGLLLFIRHRVKSVSRRETTPPE